VNDDTVRAAARRVLESAWRPDLGYCWPNEDVYPHLWLWDSCFHSIAWASLDDRRAEIELSHAMQKQFSNGFLPHMVYAGPTISRGPRADVSSFTQPPVYALAMAWANSRSINLGHSLIPAMLNGLSYLNSVRSRDGLAFVVHPWETGCDDSPRWDSWLGNSAWDEKKWTDHDQRLVNAAEFNDEEGDAVWSSEFVCAPSLFNAILSHAFLLASELTGDAGLRSMSFELGEAIDSVLWDAGQATYVDLPIVGGGESCRIPTLDGAITALGSVRRERAMQCLDQLRDPARFAAPFGLRYLPVEHPLYLPDAYWRGPAWPQLTFLAVEACRRWGQDDLAAQLSEHGKRSIVRSGWAEYWNPETGDGLGARPQTWSALAAAM